MKKYSVLAYLGLVAVFAAPTAALAQVTIPFDFSVSDGGFTSSNVSGASNPWVFGAVPAAPGGGTAWSNPGNTVIAANALSSPPVVLPFAGNITGSLTHRFNLESTNFDGGQLQFSVNGGTFNTIPADHITGVSYGGPISSSFGSPIAGQRAFANTSAGYATPAYVTSLFTFATGAAPFDTGTTTNFALGDSIVFRFLIANDSSFAAASPNWQIGAASFTLTAPEPTSMLLAGIGAMGIGWKKWRRRKA